MTTESRMARFEKECMLRTCLRCKKRGTLIPRKPKDYNKMRCTNCGTFLTIVRKD